jgi:flagella basal body P-ring formation protein FlgA
MSSSINRSLSATTLAVVCLLFSISATYAAEVGLQIQAAAKTFALKKLAVDDVNIGQLDKRLRLTACRTPLAVFLPKGARSLGKSTVGVQCNDAPGWKIYVPVHLTKFARVVVAKQSLPRDTIIGPADIELFKKDLSQQNYGYFTSVDEVIGMRLRRPIRRDETLSPSNLKPRLLVKRGDIVTILAEIKGLTVRVNGNALTDGHRGDEIRVKNQRSKRILQAEVIGPGTVRVRL